MSVPSLTPPALHDGVAPIARELLFVAHDVPDSDILLAGVSAEVEVVRLTEGSGGLEQITSALAGRTGITALHILGHGGAGELRVGTDSLTASNIDNASAVLAAWRQSLSDGADILLYGCDVGASPDGSALLAGLADLTSADVAASTDRTGAAVLSGDWDLEARTGGIEAALPFSAQALAAWQHTLDHFRYGTMSWEPVATAPNTIIIKSQLDFTATNAFIPAATPVGGIRANALTLRFGDGTSQSVSLRVLSRDTVTNDVVTEFASDLDGDGTIEASEVGVRHSYAATGQYKVSWDSSARTTAKNANGTAWQQVTTVDLGRAGNQSPTAATPALIQVKDNAVFTYQIGGGDADGNTVRFRYGTQDEFYKNGVLTEATRPTGLVLSADGLITWNITDAAVATAPGDRWQVTVMAEDLDANGAVMSSVPLDFALSIVAANAQPPVFETAPTSPQQTSSGQTSTFQFVVDDPDTANAPVVTVLNPASTDPAVFSSASTTDATGRTTLNLSLTPTTEMQGNSYVVNVRGRDTAGLTTDRSITLSVPDTTPPAPPSALALTATSDSGVVGDGRTNDTTPEVTGFAEPGTTVRLFDGATLLGTGFANSAGRWTVTPATDLSEGPHSLTATAVDPAGNASAASAVFALIIDTTPPLAAPTGLTLAAATDGGVQGDNLTNSARPTITGSAIADTTVALYDGATLLGTATTDAAGQWSVTSSVALPDGARTLTATAADTAGNASTASAPLTLTVDTVPPANPSLPVLDPASDSGLAGDNRTDVARPTLAGTAAANDPITLFDGTTAIQTTTADSAGRWSFAFTALLADGVHNLSARATDAAGNVSTTPAVLALTIDTAPPAPPTALALADASDSGAKGDGRTNDVDPTVIGVAEPGSTVRLSDSGALLGTTAADAAGRWSFTPTSVLSEGEHSLTVTASDVAGNTSTASVAFALVIDTTSPTPPTLLVLSPASDSGVRGDNVTNVARPTITGTAAPGSLVTLLDGGAPIGTAAADAETGAWSITAPVLAEGLHSFTATATDPAGNVSLASAALALTIDATPPQAPSVPVLDAASDSGGGGDGRTGDTTPTLTGMATAGSFVTVDLVGPGAVRGTVQADGTGAWSFTPTTLADGDYGVTATATDAAGNTSPASAALALTIDATAPAAPVSPTLAPASDSGAQGDNVTSTARPAITGTAEPGSTVALFEGAARLGTATADAATGAWSITPTSPFADGLHTLTATATDADGNTSAASATLALTIDTTASVAPVGLALAPASDSGTEGDGLTSATRPTITGTAEAGSTVDLYDGAALIGTATADGSGQWSLTLAAALGEGAHDLTATATDAAGNMSVASGIFALTIDTASPSATALPVLAAPSDSGAPGDNTTNATRPTINGTAEPGSTVALFEGAALLGVAVADAQTGAWAIVPTSPFADGPHTLTAAATDAAGNASAPSPALTLTIDTTPPPAPGAPVLDPDSDTGVQGDNTTSRVRPAITGTATAGSAVELREGATLLGTATADAATGAWSITPVGAFTEGLHVLTATAIDAASNASADSPPLTLIIDATAPVGPEGLALAPASDSGTPGDNLTSATRPTITGTAAPGSTVALFDGAVLIGAVTVDAGGRWSIAPELALGEGGHSLTATATDTQGNASDASAPLTLTIDTAAPTAPAALALAPASDSGTQGDNLTNAGQPAITGTAEPGSLVALAEGATPLGAAIADADGRWSIVSSAVLADGERNLTATATDAAGNLSASSAVLALTIDTLMTPPTGLALAAASDSGTAGDSLTSVVRPTVTGIAEPGSTVTLLEGPVLLGTTAADAATGAWSITAATPLADGQRALTATATDAAGNTSAASGTLALRIDTAAPAVTAALVRDNGASGDRRTSDPALTGTAPPGAAVVLSEGGLRLGTSTADAGGAWSFTPAGLTDGPHTIVASDTDAAGNAGSATVGFVFDSTIPYADYTVLDASGGTVDGVLSTYQGNVPGVQRQFVLGGAAGATILARADNTLVRGGTGGDVIVVQGGRNVLDGGGGSDWLVGGPGVDSFVVDARGRTWSTVVNFTAGDDLSLRGVQGAATFRWEAAAGADGYVGATLRGTVDGAETFAVTVAGLSVEAARRLSAIIEPDADGTPVLRLRALDPALPGEATYAITDTTTGVLAVGVLDPYQGPIAGLRYQHVEDGSASVVLVAQASDALLRGGAGADALVVRNGDNVLDGGGGSDWLIGGAGNDAFYVNASAAEVTWDTLLNFHAGDVVTVWGYTEGVSSWGWSDAPAGAAGYQGATLTGSVDGTGVDFAVTLAGLTVEQGRSLAATAGTDADGRGYLLLGAVSA